MATRSDTETGLAFGEPRGRWVLAATVLGSGMAFIDSTVVNVALPRIGDTFETGLSGLQWTINGYTLTLASLILLGGSLGDRFGRRRVFVIGVTWFAVASLLCGIAPNIETLVAARALQGIGGALLTPGSLAILQSSFRPEDRARAIGAWSGLGGIAGAAGPFLGGYLVQAVSWRLIFLINLPAALVAIAAAWYGRDREALPTHPRPLQPVGAVAIALTFGALTYGLIEGAQTGFASVLWAFGLSLAGLALFVVSERRGANPILPLELLRSRVFVAANVYTLLVYAALGGSSFYLALYLQSGAAGYSPSRASLVFVPISLVMFVLAARFGRLADRDGPRRYLTAAPLVMSIGYVLLMFVTSTNPLRPLPGVLVLALGLAMLVAPITATALKAAPDEFAGIAAGVNTTVSRLGGLIATPVLGVVITLVFAATATHHNVDPFAKHLTPDQRDATITAFRAGILASIGLCIAGSAVAFVWLPRAGEPHR
jgi:EmrB/QacA subfamily drug resistance transporter